jgi:hypothetical protein
VVLPPAQLAEWIELERAVGRPLTIEEFETRLVQDRNKKSRQHASEHAPPEEVEQARKLLRLNRPEDTHLWQVAFSCPLKAEQLGAAASLGSLSAAAAQVMNNPRASGATLPDFSAAGAMSNLYAAVIEASLQGAAPAPPAPAVPGSMGARWPPGGALGDSAQMLWMLAQMQARERAQAALGWRTAVTVPGGSPAVAAPAAVLPPALHPHPFGMVAAAAAGAHAAATVAAAAAAGAAALGARKRKRPNRNGAECE